MSNPRYYNHYNLRLSPFFELDIKTKDQIIKGLKNEIFSLKYLEKEFLSLNNKVAEMNQKYSEILRTKDEVLLQYVKKIKTSLKKLEECKIQIQNLNRKFKIIVNQQQNLSNDGSRLKKLKEQQEEKIKSFEDKIKEYNIKNQQTENQNKLLKQQIEQFKKQTELLFNEYILQTTQSKSNLIILKRLKYRHDKMSEKLQDLQKQFEIIMQDHQNHLKTQQIRNLEIISHEHQLQEVKKQHKKVKTQLGLLENQQQKKLQGLIVVQEQLKVQKSQNLRLENDISHIKASIQIVEGNKQISQEKNKKLIQQNNILNKKECSLKSEIEIYKHDYEQLKQLNQELVLKFQNYIHYDQQAIQILNRKQTIKNLLAKVNKNLKQTEIQNN